MSADVPETFQNVLKVFWGVRESYVISWVLVGMVGRPTCSDILSRHHARSGKNGPGGGPPPGTFAPPPPPRSHLGQIWMMSGEQTRAKGPAKHLNECPGT